MRVKRVYFLRPVGQLGPIKIGCSIFPEGRLDTFTLWSPIPLELICSVPGSHADEKALHGMFRTHHVHGEWFNASKDLLTLVAHCSFTGTLPPLPRVVKFPKTRHRAHTADKPKPVDRRAWAARMRAEYERGDTAQAIGERHGISHLTVLRMVRMAGGTIRSKGAPAGIQDMDRAAAMARRYMDGETLQAIGNDYGLSRERIRQILAKMHVKPSTRRAA